MKTWQITSSGDSAYTIDENGLTESRLLSAIPSTDTILPYTPTPEQVKADAQAAIDAQLLSLDIKRIRPTAEGDTAYLATLNAQAVALRAQRAAL